MMTFRHTLTLLFLGLCMTMNSQSFQPGRIITNTGDTLAGYISFNPVARPLKDCRFKPQKKAPAVGYSPDKIKAVIYDKKQQKYLRGNLPYESNSYFFKVLCEGKVNLLYQAKYDSAHYFVQKAGESAIHSLPYVRMERYVDDGYTKHFKVIESSYHIDTLKMVMKNNPALTSEIEKMKSLTQDGLIQIVNKYNSSMQSAQPQQQEVKQIATIPDKLQLLRKGKINLYKQTGADSGKRFLIQKGAGTRLIEIPFKHNENKEYQGLVIRSYLNLSTNHIDTLRKYMADASPIFEYVDVMRTPTKRKLQKVVDEYNSYIDEPTYICKHSIKRLPLNIDIVPGFYFAFINAKNPMVKFGGLAHIGFFNANKHLFFKTGFFYYKISSMGEEYSTYNLSEFNKAVPTFKMPLQLEYRVKENTVQPWISLGYNYYHSKQIVNDEARRIKYSIIKEMFQPVVVSGINIQMTKRCSARIGLECEFEGTKEISYPKELNTPGYKEGDFFPKKFYQTSLFAGIQVKL